MLRKSLPLAACFVLLASCTRQRAATQDDLFGPGKPECSSCHGDVDSPAPPVDTHGRAATTFRGVGAHRDHLLTGTLGADVPCGTCHKVPVSAADAGHMDTPLPAEVIFDGTARLLEKLRDNAPKLNVRYETQLEKKVDSHDKAIQSLVTAIRHLLEPSLALAGSTLP